MTSDKIQPLVTIAIPAFKTKYLKEAIDSALQQTYNNIEIIVVDDCSPEDIKSVIDQYASPKICYYRNEHNLGRNNPAANWNRCLQHARGEFFCLLCDDDVYDKEFVQTLYDLSTQYPDCNVFRARADFRDSQGKCFDKYPSSPTYESMEDYMWHVAKQYRRQTISEWMFRTIHMQKCNGYAMLPLAWYADYLSIFTFAKEGGIASSSNTLMHFRQSGINLSSRDSENTELKIQASRQYMQALEELMKGNEDYSSIKDQMTYLVGQHTKYHLKHAKLCALLKLYKKRKLYGLAQKELIHAIF